MQHRYITGAPNPHSPLVRAAQSPQQAQPHFRFWALCTLASAGALAPIASAQGTSVEEEQPWAVLPESFCKDWKNFGTLYKDPENPNIQEIKFFGRMHYQYGYLDGDAGGQSFNYDTEELRRLRAGLGSKFLEIFDLYAEGEFSDDNRPRDGEFNIEFQHMWQLKLHMDAKKAFDLDGVDGLKFGVGSREINMSYEWVTSSKRIKTVERSAIANKIWAFNSDFANPTGAWVTTNIKPVTWTVGAFSTTQDQYLAPWNDGELYYNFLHWDFDRDANGDKTDVRWATFYQDRSGEDEVLAAGIDWATALSMQHKTGPWEFHVEGIAGDNGDQSNADREGKFWGAVLMPSYWIHKDSLEAVVKFQYQGSEESEGIRLNSRYIRRAGSVEDIPSIENGRGDEHYSLYAGVNKLLCGHQHKLMFGLEYDSLHQDGEEIFDGLSLLLAYRTYW